MGFSKPFLTQMAQFLSKKESSVQQGASFGPHFALVVHGVDDYGNSRNGAECLRAAFQGLIGVPLSETECAPLCGLG